MKLGRAELDALADGARGHVDVACPLCGPLCRLPHNRKRRVLRIWCDGGGISYNCVRCGAHGWARRDGTAFVDRRESAELHEEAAKREANHRGQQLSKAKALWARNLPLQGSLAETYLREARSYSGPLPASIRFLEPRRPEHHPAMIAAFGVVDEPEPGLLVIADENLRGVHLTLLKPQGSGKAGTECDKFMVGPSLGSPIVLAPMNDLLGLNICEGIETGLSLYEATGCGVWVAGSASRLSALADAVPAYAECVTIAADDDEAGTDGAIKLAERLCCRGIDVELSVPVSWRAVA